MNKKNAIKSPGPDNWSAYSMVAIGLAVSILYIMNYQNFTSFDFLVIAIGIIIAGVGGYKLLKSK